MKIISFNKSFNSDTVVPSGIRPVVITAHNSIISPEMLKKINSFNFSGIYAILSNSTSDFLFIGSATNISKRIHQHITGFTLDNDASSLQLRNHYKQYGIDDFDFIILERIDNTGELDKISLFKKEREYIEANEPLYNVRAYRKQVTGNKRYTEDTEPTQSYYNDKILNEFGNPIVNSFSIRKNHIRKKRIVNNIDDDRKHWKPTYVIVEDEGFIQDRGDIKKKKTPITEVANVVETIVIRKSPFNKLITSTK